MTKLNYHKIVLATFFILLASVLFMPKKAEAKCLEDIEILILVEHGVKTACSTYGEIQLDYLRGSFLSSLAKGKFEGRHSGYTASRTTFISPQFGSPKISVESLDVFQLSLLASSFYGGLEGKRGALYIIAYMGMANTLSEEKRRGSAPILDAFYNNVEFDFDYEGDDLVLFAMCFWEYDIPSLPVETVFEADVISQCIKENRYNL
ncbi:MAG: hypothetical protein ACTSRN_00345 [Alphaproteobacteria bacterium]